MSVASTNQSLLLQRKSMIFCSNGHISECSYNQCLPACSVPMLKCHYTFNFVEQLLPNHALQVGPLHFKVPYRVQLFGVCMMRLGLSKSITFLAKEIQSEKMGQNIMGLTV